ncbi:hypothetical protein F4801DRAFT_29850 [Xylaria longipes]|nr:hypothetical protein F4801DRAFT_29850 [Xylaria longipes]RYC60804.1 hypothetical protein CHU98_g5385 [Xylaria longipes]
MPTFGAFWRRKMAALLQRTPSRLPRPPPISPHSRSDPPIRVRFYTKPTTNAPHSRRISRILAGASRFMPKRLRGALQDLRSAPLSHIVAFLVLHEITAVLPVIGLAYAFYTLDYVPVNWAAVDGLRKWANYFEKKRWLGHESGDDTPREDPQPAMPMSEPMDEKGAREFLREFRENMERHVENREEKGDAGTAADDSTSMSLSEGTTVDWKSRAAAGLWEANPQLKRAVSSPPKAQGLERADDTEWPPDDFDATKVRIGDKLVEKKHSNIIIQVAAAYAITKMLLVPRIALSLWLTPWLARGFVGLRRALRRKRS